MRLIIFDTETTGTNEHDSVCEIAATLYQVGETERTTGAIASISTLLPVTYNDAEEINGICPELTLAAKNLDETLMFLREMRSIANYSIAFNAEFDSPLVDQLLGKHQWLCAMRDIDWGYPNINAYGGFKLIDLALWLGIGVSTVHRAGDDVRLLVECFNRRRSGLQEMLELAVSRASSPTIELRALVVYENRHLAKESGFAWDDQRRIWVKKIRDCDSEAFVKNLKINCELQNH